LLKNLAKKSWMIKKYFNTVKYCRATLFFSGQAQVAQKSWDLLDVVYNILNMQLYVTSVARQTCSYGGTAAKGGSQYLCLNENVRLLRHRKFYPSDMASLA